MQCCQLTSSSICSNAVVMSGATPIAVLVLLACVAGRALGADLAVDGAAQPAALRSPFVIGAPGRLDGAGDRRHPRRYLRDDSAIGAYADVEEVEDPTWLRHEIHSYTRRTVDCAGTGPPWCGRAVRRLGAGRVIALTSGTHAEAVWLSRGNRAVRLGWRRIVVTPSGSMTLDAPPAEFARALLAEFPSQIEALELDAARESAWAGNEVDRLAYYADQVMAALPAVGAEQHRRHALHFVEENLARIAQVGAQHVGQVPAGEPPLPHDLGAPHERGASPHRLAERLAAVHAWRAADSARPWCSAQRVSSAAVSVLSVWRE
jgi:hypothetical protein